MKKLTLKQQRFVNAYIRTGNAKESAKIAGYEGNDHTLEQAGYENLRKPEVTKALAEALQPETDLRERVVAEVKLLAFTPSDEPLGQNHKLKALEILAKFTQMFDDAPKVNVNIPKDWGDIREMTEEQLVAELERYEKRKAQRAVEEALERAKEPVTVSFSSESLPPQEQEASLHTPPSSVASVLPPAPHTTQLETLPVGFERIAQQ